MPPVGPWLPAAVTAVGGLLTDLFRRRSEKKQYQEMLHYNSPAEQMRRYTQAGLSPYLIYGAANAGNASTPAPVTTSSFISS